MVGTAGVAGTVAGRGSLGSQSLVVLPHQILVGDAVVHMRPRGHLVQRDGALAVEGRVDAQILIRPFDILMLGILLDRNL